MKTLILLLTISLTTSLYSQTYKLLPDSCTYCFYFSSTGGMSWYENQYLIDPSADTMINGENYIQLFNGDGFEQPFAYRQVGNKLMGYEQWSMTEHKIMDFDAQVGDTIENLYSEGLLYSAIVDEKDSILVNNGEYHHFMNLTGIGYYDQSFWVNTSWGFTWHEKGLCGNVGGQGGQWGGFIYNIIDLYVISAPYYLPTYCTTDSTYTNAPYSNCDNCVPNFTSLNEEEITKFTVRPNPVESQLFLESSGQPIQQIRILDTSGKEQLLLKNKSGIHQIDVSKLPSGMYFLQILSKGKYMVNKIIKK